MPHTEEPSLSDELNPLWGVIPGDRATIRDSGGRFLARGIWQPLKEQGGVFFPIPQELVENLPASSCTLEISGSVRRVKSIHVAAKTERFLQLELLF